MTYKRKASYTAKKQNDEMRVVGNEVSVSLTHETIMEFGIKQEDVEHGDRPS